MLHLLIYFYATIDFNNRLHDAKFLSLSLHFQGASNIGPGEDRDREKEHFLGPRMVW